MGSGEDGVGFGTKKVAKARMDTDGMTVPNSFAEFFMRSSELV